MSAADPVRGSWITAVSGLSGDVDKAASSADDLQARYDEPHRHYHTLAHITTVLREATLLADELDLNVADREVLMLAVCAHDVVYDGHPGDDERASAVWARTQLADAGVDEDAVARVGDLILATINHQADVDDRVADALLDADLSILGASPEAYDAYTVAVRQEYSQVPDRLWRAGRADVLSRLLDREHLYRTPGARGRWEAAARQPPARASPAGLRCGADDSSGGRAGNGAGGRGGAGGCVLGDTWRAQSGWVSLPAERQVGPGGPEPPSPP